MNIKNKVGRGFVLVAPPHSNPENLPNRYLFTGTERDSSAEMAFTFCVIPVPGFVMPEEFAAHLLAARGTLHGTAELYAPEFDLGEFRYRLASGEEQKVQADDVMTVSPEKLRELKPKEPEKTEPVPPVTPPPPPVEPEPEPDVPDMFP